MYVHGRCCVRVRLAERRTRELAAHRDRAVRLGKRWNSIQQKKRVLIHLPSLGNVVLFIVDTHTPAIIR